MNCLRAFKAKMFIVDNSDGADFERDVMATYRSISAWAKKTPTNKAAKKWIDGQKAKRNITEILDEAKFNTNQLEVISVNRSMSTPDGLQKGFNIERLHIIN